MTSNRGRFQLRAIKFVMMSVFYRKVSLSNNQSELRKADAADVWLDSELSGCLPLAPPCGFGHEDCGLASLDFERSRSFEYDGVGIAPVNTNTDPVETLGKQLQWLYRRRFAAQCLAPGPDLAVGGQSDAQAMASGPKGHDFSLQFDSVQSPRFIGRDP